jgi:hypothetical protein
LKEFGRGFFKFFECRLGDLRLVRANFNGWLEVFTIAGECGFGLYQFAGFSLGFSSLYVTSVFARCGWFRNRFDHWIAALTRFGHLFGLSSNDSLNCGRLSGF